MCMTWLITQQVTVVTSCVSHDFFVYVTWRGWHCSFVRVAWLICVCDLTHSCVWHDSFMCVAWLNHVCGMTYSCVWRDSFMCDTWRVHVWRERFSWYKTWLIQVCDMTHSCVSRDFFAYVTWPLCLRMSHIYHVLCGWYDVFLWVSWLIQVRAKTHPRVCDVTHPCVWYKRFLPRQMTHPRVWHDLFLCHDVFTNKSCHKRHDSFNAHCNTLQHTATHCNTLQHSFSVTCEQVVLQVNKWCHTKEPCHTRSQTSRVTSATHCGITRPMWDTSRPCTCEMTQLTAFWHVACVQKFMTLLLRFFVVLSPLLRTVLISWNQWCCVSKKHT